MNKNIFIDNIFRDEPIQTKLFTDVLNRIGDNYPSMIELGCAEAAYSQVFNNFFNGKCKNLGVDVLPRQIDVAKKVCENCIFYHGYFGELIHLQENVENTFNAIKLRLKDLLIKNNISKLNIIHMDIQGSETYVLEEILNDSLCKDIEYYFISTHGIEIHNKCLNIIDSFNIRFEFLFNSPEEGGLGDGLIVLKNLNFNE